MKRFSLSLCALILLASAAAASAAEPVVVKKGDRCQVCGMFVAKYKNWTAQILFTGGGYAAFDGPKDMMKFYLDVQKYSPSKKRSDISDVYVTEYYSAKLMDARKLFFVVGSDVLGPMGKELVPIATEARAREFMKDHRGSKILRFEEITAEHLQ